MITKTQLEQDIANADRAAQGTIYYGGLLVTALNRAAWAIWTLPDDRLEALLNHLGAEKVQSLLNEHAGIGVGLNAALDVQQASGPRVEVTPPRAFSVDQETGHITVEPLPVEE